MPFSTTIKPKLLVGLVYQEYILALLLLLTSRLYFFFQKKRGYKEIVTDCTRFIYQTATQCLAMHTWLGSNLLLTCLLWCLCVQINRHILFELWTNSGATKSIITILKQSQFQCSNTKTFFFENYWLFSHWKKNFCLIDKLVATVETDQFV